MRVSKNKVNKSLENELFATLHQAVADLKSPREVQAFFEAFLSNAEYTTLAKRLAVAYWLDKKRSYGNIHQNLKVSSATIATIQNLMKESGVRITLQKIKAEEWANVWTKKIKQFVKV